MKVKTKSKQRKKKLINSSIRLPKDFPWKLLGTLAEDLSQYLNDTDNSLLVTIIRNRDIEGYYELSEDWGLQSMATSDAPLSENKAKYLLTSFLKKYQFATDKNLRQEAAFKKFVAAEINCHRYNHSGYKSLAWADDQLTRHVFTYARSWIQKVIGISIPDDRLITDRSRHGPGATTGTSNGQNSAFFKFADWPYDCTVRARRHAITMIKSDERWLGALEDDYRTRNNIPKNMILNQQVFWDSVLNIVDGNKITFVPKSGKIDRTIAIEPTLNLYLQLGVDGFIRSRLKRWSINLDDQTKNQKLAREGSMDRGDNSPVTLDLAAASDSISTGVCKQLLPKEWYDYLMNLRSPCGVLKGKSFQYGKISSMGNGFTFALETLIFSAISYGVLKYHNQSVDMEQFAVYGDDIIVPKRFASDVISVLKKSGFALNTDKSFLKGFVRESCGADWFHGTPVRPLTITTMPTSVKELFAVYNRLKRHLDLRYGITSCSSLDLLRSWIPSGFKHLTGPLSDTEFDTYIHDNVKLNTSYTHGCWNFVRIVNVPDVIRSTPGKKFHFQKLMATLYPTNPPTFWDMVAERKLQPIPVWKRVPDTGGSIFNILRGKPGYVAYINSRTDFWCENYSEQLPFTGVSR